MEPIGPNRKFGAMGHPSSGRESCEGLGFNGEIDTVARNQKVRGSQDDYFVGVLKKNDRMLLVLLVVYSMAALTIKA
jgi:hypothetical protein